MSSCPPVNDTFSVPEGGATVVASLTVDDWGKLTISGPGGTFELDLTSAADEPGKLGRPPGMVQIRLL